MKKWNPKLDKFEPYNTEWACTMVPDVESITERVDTVIQCAYCGKKIKFGDSIMSHFIQPDDAKDINNVPSYAMCRDCAKAEIEEGKC